MPITRSLTSIRRSRDPEFPTEEELEQAYNHARLTLCSQGYNLTEGIARELYEPSINDINDINNIQALEVVIISKFLKAIEGANMFRRKENNNGRSRRNYRNYVIRYDNLNKREIILIDNDDNDDDDNDDNDDDNVGDNDGDNDDNDVNNDASQIQRDNTTNFPNISSNESIVVFVLIESHNISKIKKTYFLILNLLIFLGLLFWFSFLLF